MELSIIIPVYNGSKTIKSLVNTVCNEFVDLDFEIILVNDGSCDASEKVCEEIALTNKCVKFISLRKNFGEFNAVMCGLHYVEGSYATIIDDDFQNPPSEVRVLHNEAKRGDFDVVYSKYHKKQHNLFRNIGSAFNDKMATFLIKKPKDLYLSSFKLIKKELVQEIIKYTGPFPYIDGLIFRATDSYSSVFTAHEKRVEGSSNYTFSKLISVYLNMFLNFSVKPLRVFTAVGFIIFIIGAILTIISIIEKLRYPQTPLGWTSIFIAVLTFSGFQIVFLGMIGEYLGKLFLDQNKTPQYVIKKEVLH